MPTHRQINKLDLVRVGSLAVAPRLHQAMVARGYATESNAGIAQLTPKGEEVVRAAIWIGIDLGAAIPAEEKQGKKKP